MELMILKPSFAKKLNGDGFSPLHLADENHQIELALALIKFDPDLVRIHGKGGMTPLHLAIKNGVVDLLTEFLLVSPESIKDVTLNGETALHITVMNDRYNELKVLRGWIQRMRKKDSSSIEIQVVAELLKCMSLNRNILNKNGMTALDVLRANGADMNRDTENLIQKAGGKNAASLSELKTASVFLMKPVTFCEYCSIGISRYRNEMTDGTRNALLVIAALMITATYETVVQPYEKGGQDDYLVEDVTTAYKIEMVLVWGFNTIAFGLAIALTFILLPVGRAYTWWYILISVPLVCSFGISVYLKYNIQTHYIIIYLIVMLGFLVYLLVFYVQWKRTTHKKVPEPISDLIFRG
ncbi:unnamed protein product [Microthlaspi erraticum]|uniref:Uncharacterized protein n=1 Tax=Microthlaspi erraticum TaxID=1685480 RepID=A0A6D2K9S7_9BRAS|nr:unnamed protein product [Microthlaspi erraticum]